MVGTKIMVFHLRQIIKTAVFSLIGLILILLMVFFFVPKNTPQKESVFVPGTYTSQIILHNTPMDINVTVDDSKILEITLNNMAFEQEVFFPLFQPTLEKLAAKIIDQQNLQIDISQDDPLTSQILLDAISSALTQAKYQDDKAATNKI